MLQRITQNKKLAVWIAIIWTALILIACLIPGREIPNVHIPLMDKYVHFIIFAGFSFLWLCTRNRPHIATGVWIFIASVALGYLVELLQGSGITYGRSYEAADVLADAIGGLIGVLLFFLFKRLRWV